MAAVFRSFGRYMRGKTVDVILPFVGKFRFQLVKLRIGKKHIVVSAIAAGGCLSLFFLSLFFYLYTVSVPCDETL